MVIVRFLVLFGFALGCYAWNTTPHRIITRAALDTLPAKMRSELGTELDALIAIYCMLPDRYTEMQKYGFARKGPGPHEASEIRMYCVRPDEVEVHSATWNRDEDLASLVFLFERILTSLGEHHPTKVAMYIGTLSHFIADSLSPPHAAPGIPAETHTAIERSVPEFVLDKQPKRFDARGIVELAEAVLDRCYEGGARNHDDLPAMTQAVAAKDEKTLDRYRLRAGREAATLLAEAIYALFTLADGGKSSMPARPVTE